MLGSILSAGYIAMNKKPAVSIEFHSSMISIWPLHSDIYKIF